VLGRFGVDKNYQRQGLGEDLLRKALERSAEIAEHIGAFAVILHPLDKDVGRYYSKRGFKPIRTEPPAMMVPMADIRAAFSQRSGD
ncbi:MAG: GNAT family N-acetyltransferase, partial [Deltaproteobacteria bacterium]|nr:GNAT family N-acetyltransferase [Deltaproteobacteria bacterium]